MQEAALSLSTSLPLRLRLRRACWIALLLGLWAPAKIVWEQNIAQEQNFLRYSGSAMTLQLRDQLSQGLTIGVLSGMRSVVADFVWLNVVTAWMNQDWFKMGAYIDLTTALQPRAPVFWDIGGWQLAYNASIDAQNDVAKEPNAMRRLKASRFWTERGLAVFKRGLENNPTYWRLWMDIAQLYDNRLKDYHSAAYYYQKAGEQPNAMTYLERFPAHMYDAMHANDPALEYAEWKKLWLRLTPEQKKEPRHTAGEVERQIRLLENKLSVPKEKRVFPN